MSQLHNALDRVAGYRWITIGSLDKIRSYIFDHDDRALAAITPHGHQGSFWGHELAKALARPDQMQEEDRRAIHVLVRLGFDEYLWSWLDGHLANEPAGATYHEAIRRELLAIPPVMIAAHTLARVRNLTRDGQPTSAGRYMLSLADAELRGATEAMDRIGSGVALWRSGLPLATLMIDHAPQRVPALLDVLLRQTGHDNRAATFALLLSKGQGQYEARILADFDGEKDTWSRFHQAQVLFDFDAAKYRDRALAAARASLEGPSGRNNHGPVGQWMIAKYGREILPDLLCYVESRRGEHIYWTNQILEEATKAFGRDAIPLLHAAFKLGEPKAEGTVRRLAFTESIHETALGLLIGLRDATQDTVIQKELEAGLALEGVECISYLRLAGKWRPERVQERVWGLLEHKSKQVRDAVAATLARIGDAAVPRATGLLEHKKAEVRTAAATLLGAIGTASAATALEARLNIEKNEDVRDVMLLGLESAWASQGRQVTREDVAARIERSAAKLADPVASWLDESQLPPLCWAGGGTLNPQEVRYLLYRQSRAREIRPDVEARPMFALLDKTSAGPFAAAVLQGFLASGADAADRWALTVAGLLGDDRLVPVLGSQIRHWVEAGRGKLAEYAVDALALLGSDAALLAVDAMALRYRNKMKNVGKAAAEAFAAAAARRGISQEELGDRVVPWLGFEPNKPRLVTCGTGVVEVFIGPDLKLAYKDVAKNKPIKTLPKSAPAETVRELKDVAANLREVTKAQTLRLENLLVQQRHWPVPRWRELFLGHPLLRPFAVRLVWGNYDSAGQLVGLFRALEDRSLTTRSDDPYVPMEASTVGMVHPLEISEQERRAWQTHLADYEIQPPFPQVEREVVLVPAEQRTCRRFNDLDGKSINGLTFKSRAERLGWHRGSVVDGGGIVGYFKSFPAAGADVYLFVEGLYMGIDMTTEITLQHALFLRSGSVQMGSYTYDEPSDENDPRVLAFGEVPAIVYSEAIGDLRKIGGKTSETEDLE